MDREFSSFAIKDIFDILPGKRLVAADSVPGDRPFVSPMNNGNGIARFVGDMNESLDSNVLGVNYNGIGGMGIGFYHPYECIFSDDVKRFHLRCGKDECDTLLFAKVSIESQRRKFSYNYKFNATRMASTRIMLPEDAHGNPDWDFMASFTRSMRGGVAHAL